MNQTALIAITDIVPNPEQPRKYFDPVAMRELANSIKEHGVMQPISVERAGASSYILHAGERRWRASRMVGLTHIPAVMVDPLNGDGPEVRLVKATVENVQRENMHPVEEARAYARLRDEFKLSTKEIAQKMGKQYMHINMRLKLVELDDSILELMMAGLLPVSPDAVRALKKVPNEERVEFAERLADSTNGRKVEVAHVVRAVRAVRMQISMSKAVSQRWDIFSFAGVDRQSCPTLMRKATNTACKKCQSFLMKASPTMCMNCPLVDQLKIYRGLKE